MLYRSPVYSYIKYKDFLFSSLSELIESVGECSIHVINDRNCIGNTNNILRRYTLGATNTELEIEDDIKHQGRI